MPFIFLSIFLIGLSGLIIGILIGFFLREFELREGLRVFTKAFIRTTKKKWLRFKNPDIDIYRVQRDQTFIELPKEKRAELADVRAKDIIAELKLNLFTQFENQIDAVYLFGSRARGDYQPDSDLDVGIFLTKSCAHPEALRKDLIYHSIKTALKYGYFLQPRIFNPTTLNKPSENYLSQAVKSYGVQI